MNILSKEATKSHCLYENNVRELGTIQIRPFSFENDLELIHTWVNQKYALYWGMVGHTKEEVQKAYEKILEHANVFIGTIEGEQVFLVECYHPKNDPIGLYYDVQEGDVGMHVLVAPTEKPIHQFTWHVFSTIMKFLFADKTIKRVVVEPDVRNHKIHVLNKRAGFEYSEVLELPHKTAHLAFCTEIHFKKALKEDRELTSALEKQANPVLHLQPLYWAKATQRHLCKAISEFAHELLLIPILQYQEKNWGHYFLRPHNSEIEYRFKAQKLFLDHWHIEEGSLVKNKEGTCIPLDSLHFILEFQQELGISNAMLPVYLEEISSTLYSSAYCFAKKPIPASSLIHSDFQTIEHAMQAGHPCFVANNGRIGFDAIDYLTYAPEADHPFQLIWLAGHKSRTTFTSTSELSYNFLLQQELGDEAIFHFQDVLKSKALEPENYYFFPVHPWQWSNKLSIVFASDIATQQLVYLGKGEDNYLAQQSIRTLYNQSEGNKFYVKSALSILNMGFMRGLSPYYMESTPAITEWIRQKLDGDEYLDKLGFTLLCEVATVGYRNTYYEQLGRSHAYNKMLATLWRESPTSVLDKGQKAFTMASLLHIDTEGNSFVAALIKAAGIDTKSWVKAYLKCYLTPLLHCFYTHDLVFMPHGENLILVVDNHVPVKAIMKDITEEIMFYGPVEVLPEKVKRIAVPTPEDIKVLSIFTDVFDCFFRFLSSILNTHIDLKEEEFWKLVAENIQNYQQEHLYLEEKFKQYNLFTPAFARCCLNRLQLKNNQQMLDLADPINHLQFVGELKNPVAIFQEQLEPEVLI